VSTVERLETEQDIIFNRVNANQKYLKFWHQIFVILAGAGIQDFKRWFPASTGTTSGFPPSRE